MSTPFTLHEKLQIVAVFRGEDDRGDLVERAAKQHGADSDPEHEVGDLQVFLRAALTVMSADQRAEFYRRDDVRETLATGLGVEVADLRF